MTPGESEPGLEPATLKDARSILHLIEEAGWAYTRDEISRLIEVQPGGLLLLRGGGIRHGVLGCVYASAWGPLGFIGLMLVRADRRNKGLGTRMMLEAMEHLEAEGVGAIGLDAVGDAIGFYRRLGFRSAWESLRSGIDTSRVELPEVELDVRSPTETEMGRALEMDARVSGMDRSAILRKLWHDPDSTVLVVPGPGDLLAFGVLRRSKGCLRLGPVVATDGVDGSAAVRALVSAAVTRTYPRMLTMNVPAYNREAVELLTAMGAVQYSPCMRMYSGDPGPAGAPEGVWALGAAEKG